MAKMTAYSMMMKKMIMMQVTMQLSIAFRLLEEEEGALALNQISCESFRLVEKHSLDCIEGVDDDQEEDDKKRHSARNNTGIDDETDPGDEDKQHTGTVDLYT